MIPAWRAGTATLFVVPARQTTYPGGVDSSESIPGLHKRLQIRALNSYLSFFLLDALSHNQSPRSFTERCV